MNMPLKIFIVSLVAGALLGQSSEPPPAAIAVEKAYAGLINSPEFPRFQNDRDQELIEILRNHPQETVKLLSSLMLKGQTKENIGRTGALLYRLRYPIGLEILRIVNRTYDPDDLENPARGGLIASGEPEDMEQFKQRITQLPDTDFSMRLANKMADSSNTHAQLALFDLRDKIPGKWQEGEQVKELFTRGYLLDLNSGSRVPLPAKYANSAPPITPPRDTSSHASVAEAASSKTREAKSNETSADLKPVVSSAHATNIWPWGVCGVLLLALVMLLFRKLK